MKLLIKGNIKIKCLSFSLPVYKCCKNICKGCYSLKAEKQYTNVRNRREFNYNESSKDTFITDINSDIQSCKNIRSINTKICRINTDGDFYSQKYVDEWVRIVFYNPEVQFYAYTKRFDDFDFSDFCDNMNLINSITPLGVNYGSEEYCSELQSKHGYVICPCRKNVTVDCMGSGSNSCKICLQARKICFIQH